MAKHSRLFMVLLLLFLNNLAFASTAFHYAVIVDAGSTGSRLHLFEYTNEAKLPVIHDIFSESTKPGLSSYENNPEEAARSLQKPLDDAMIEIQKKQVDPTTVTISILGTAGMRLLPAEKQQAIYTRVSLYLKNNYPLTLGEIKTIPGNMEGLFGWLDINYLLKSFDSRTDITKGSIDIGGASIQIVFTTLDHSKPEDTFKLKIGEQSYTVYSKSFLGMGLVEALNHINSQPLAATCYPVGYAVTATEKGRFNFANCSNLYLDLINQHEVKQQLPSLANKNFIAYSGAYYTDSFFAVDQTPGQEQLITQIQAVCNKTWEQLVAAYPREPEKYLSLYCANGVYLSQLFYSSYQLKEQQLTVTNQINQQDLNWTLGALLYQQLLP